MVQINDTDIKQIEHILLSEGCTFNDERVQFIQCMESRDVIACPGSGKTTALLAKILILASKMPFADERGVCVLTHTNVAINEIKARLGTSAECLFSSPNYFGTIQSFVNRFLAMPLFRNEFRKSPHSIDADIFNSAVDKLYSRTRKAQYRLKNFGGDASSVGFLWTSPRDLTVEDALRTKYKQISDTEQSFSEIVSIRKQLLGEGVLSYRDAYSLSLRYLEICPLIVKTMRKRFGFVFLDEAQDTDEHQFEILNKLFLNGSDVIIQCLGDPNQAIYRSVVQKDMIWSPKPNSLAMSDTKRFGKTIVKILDTVRVNRQISLTDNPDRKSKAPHIITYKHDSIRKVLQAYARLIRNSNLIDDKDIQNKIFKAVGWIGKDKTADGKLCLRYYFPEYRRSITTRKQYFSNMLSYLYSASNKELETKGAKVYKDAIMQAIIHAFNLGAVRNPESGRRFTADSFLKWYRENNETSYVSFVSHLSDWIISLHRKERTPIQIRDIIAKAIRNKNGIQMTNDLEDFLANNTLEYLVEEQNTSNIFTSEDGISIEIGTVHSVKGETHTATLYLETYYQKRTDSQRLIEFLKGNYPLKEREKTYHAENLKIAHVAFSRPTHLLAFACNESSIKGSEDDLRNKGWEISSVEELLNMGRSKAAENTD